MKLETTTEPVTLETARMAVLVVDMQNDVTCAPTENTLSCLRDWENPEQGLNQQKTRLVMGPR